jgi:ubiquinone/menaquinone biosynthesis C-methylase UbiE
MVADGNAVPFRSGSFDGLFAGEIIEHVPDPRTTLLEWNRVLKPGGIMVLTTPNMARLSNWRSGTKTPISPDHLSEMSYREVSELLEQEGFEILDYQGFHLELFGKWLTRGRYHDRLMGAWNKPRYRKLMQVALRLGRLFGTRALGMIFVAAKRAEPRSGPS